MNNSIPVPISGIRGVPRRESKDILEVFLTLDGETVEADPEPKIITPLFEITNTPGKPISIFLKDNRLREFLFHSTSMDSILKHDMIQSDNDNRNTRRLRDKLAHIALDSIVSFLPHLRNADTDRLAADDISATEWNGFLEAIENQKRDQEERFQAMVETEAFDFYTLMVLFSDPDVPIGYVSKEKQLIGKTLTCTLQEDMFTGIFLRLKMQTYVADKGGIVKSTVEVRVSQFEGIKPLKELGIRILKNTPEGENYKKAMAARGEKYLSLVKDPAYKMYTGSLTYRTYQGVTRLRSTGRIMVDEIGMRSNHPNYSKYFAKDGNFEHHRSDEDHTMSAADITDDVKMSISPFLYGYSLTAKMWGEFDIDNISDIQFSADAYDKLVLDEDTKVLLKTLVSAESFESTDIIKGKGGGCIALLEGKPGIGKTLSAEVIAEVLKKPLYMVSVGELGTNVEYLEESLKKVLDVCQSWNAVLLIDEADIFLESRSDLDIERNAMVAVFLRLLEYYNGILFLTTNRADNIDEAFFSRISVAISYPDLSKESRIKIWNNNLELFKLKLDPKDLKNLVKYKLNGRQIKNIVRNASSFARTQGRVPDLQDIQLLVNKTVAFSKGSWMKHVRHFFHKIFA